jgi:thioredoxin 1
MPKSMVINITERNFGGEVLKSKLPVFACFVTSWCHSCFPACFIANELARQYEGTIKFVKVDAEKAPKISVRYNIRSFPCIVIFLVSQPVNILPGYQEKTSLISLLDTIVTREKVEGNEIIAVDS